MSEAQQLENKPCGVCGSSQSTHLFEARDYIYGNAGSWPVAQCANCGVVFMNPRIPPAAIGPFYPKTYYTNSGETRVNDSFRDRLKYYLIRRCYGYPPVGQTSILIRIIGTLLRPLASRMGTFQHNIRHVPGGRVLDVGCGNGWCLDTYKRLGWQTYGTEMGPDSAKLAQEAGHNVFLGELKDARYPDNSFDVLTLWDALEHIHNPAETIAELNRVCRPGGWIYIYVPNYGSGYARRFRDRWFMFTAPLHYYHYTAESLTLLLNKEGFNQVEMHFPLGGAGFKPTLAAATLGQPIRHALVTRGPLAYLLKLADRLMPDGHLLAIARKQA
jgi:2-polyprenyl-3-methyl-5-hydroxy-6-metoxy-1,4-benzoquinol methylase